MFAYYPGPEGSGKTTFMRLLEMADPSFEERRGLFRQLVRTSAAATVLQLLDLARRLDLKPKDETEVHYFSIIIPSKT